ncbi:MAG: hypothetical protein RIQ81_1162 [Pseudomonadota bacterium]
MNLVQADILKDLFAATRLVSVVQALLIFIAGMVLVRLATSWLRRVLERAADQQAANTGSKVAYYILSAIVILSALRQMGFDLQVLLGAAGVLTVAVGFASQTSVANLISGLFIIFEKPFTAGDWIRIGSGPSGQVLGIGFLSTRIRTADNLMVRYPNETLMKVEVTNLTRHPIRRFDLRIGVSYSQDLRRFREMLLGLATAHPMVMDEPSPGVIVESFDDAALHVRFSVWVRTGNFIDVKESLLLQVKEALDRHGIAAPVSSAPTVILQTTTPATQPG